MDGLIGGLLYYYQVEGFEGGERILHYTTAQYSILIHVTIIIRYKKKKKNIIYTLILRKFFD